MKEKKTKKQLKKGKNNPEESEKWVQKTQKVTINYFSRGEFREKRMNMMDIYAIICEGSYLIEERAENGVNT